MNVKSKDKMNTKNYLLVNQSPTFNKDRCSDSFAQHINQACKYHANAKPVDDINYYFHLIYKKLQNKYGVDLEKTDAEFMCCDQFVMVYFYQDTPHNIRSISVSISRKNKTNFLTI